MVTSLNLRLLFAKLLKLTSSNYLRSIAFVLILQGGDVAQAQTLVTVSGVLIAQISCVINGEKMIDVNFGDHVAIARVDGKNYKKNIPYTLVCKGNISNPMRMKIAGTSTSFDKTALTTNVDDFGIALFINGKRQVINDWMEFDYEKKPRLTAVPVKRPGAVLSTGDFNATATLLVDYR